MTPGENKNDKRRKGVLRGCMEGISFTKVKSLQKIWLKPAVIQTNLSHSKISFLVLPNSYPQQACKILPVLSLAHTD